MLLVTPHDTEATILKDRHIVSLLGEGGSQRVVPLFCGALDVSDFGTQSHNEPVLYVPYCVASCGMAYQGAVGPSSGDGRSHCGASLEWGENREGPRAPITGRCNV